MKNLTDEQYFNITQLQTKRHLKFRLMLIHHFASHNLEPETNEFVKINADRYAVDQHTKSERDSKL